MIFILILCFGVFLIQGQPNSVQVGVYPTDGNRRLNFQQRQVVSTDPSLDLLTVCSCDGQVPCPLPPVVIPVTPLQCKFVPGPAPSTSAYLPIISPNLTVYMQFYMQPNKYEVAEFVGYIQSCTFGSVLRLFAFSNDIVPWPENNIGPFTWQTRPLESGNSSVEVASFTCPVNIALNRRFTLTINVAEIINLFNVNSETITFAYISSQSFAVAMSYGYNTTVSAALFPFGYDTYSEGRNGVSYTSSFYPYYIEPMLWSSPLHLKYPIGFPMNEDTKISFVDYYSLDSYEQARETSTFFSVNYTSPVPVVTEFVNLNLDATPAASIFYSSKNWFEYWNNNGPLPFYTPYGLCLSLFANLQSSFCANTNLVNGYTSVGDFSFDGVLESTNFPVYNAQSEVMGYFALNLFDERISNLAGNVYPMKNLQFTSTGLHYGQATIYALLFVFDMTESVDSNPRIRLERYSAVAEITVNVYRVNEGPVVVNDAESFIIPANTGLETAIDILNVENDGIFDVVLTESPKIGNVTFSLDANGTWTWTYQPWPFFNSVNNNNNESDTFSFVVRDNSSSPCGLPFPEDTVNLADPVTSCDGCGKCVSNVATVHVYVDSIYPPPIAFNSSYAIEAGSQFPVVIPFDDLILFLTSNAQTIASVNVVSQTENANITLVPTPDNFIYTYTLTSPVYSGFEVVNFTVTDSEGGVSNFAYLFFLIGQSPSLSKSQSRSQSQYFTQSNSQSRSMSDSRSNSVSNSQSYSQSQSDSRSDSLSSSQSQSDSWSFSQSQSVSYSMSASASASQSKSFSTSQSSSKSKSLSESMSQSYSASKSASSSQSSSHSNSASQSFSSTMSDSHSDSQSVSRSISQSASNSNSRSDSFSDSQSNSHSRSASFSQSNSLSGSSSYSRSNSQSDSNSNSHSHSVTQSLSSSRSNSNSISQNQTNSPSESQSDSQSRSISQSDSKSFSGSDSQSRSLTSSLSKTQSDSQSLSSSGSQSRSMSSSFSATQSDSQSFSLSGSQSVGLTPSFSKTQSDSQSLSSSVSRSRSLTHSSPMTQSESQSSSVSGSRSRSLTSSFSGTQSNSWSQPRTQSNSQSFSRSNTRSESGSDSHSQSTSATLSNSKSNSDVITQSSSRSASNSYSGSNTLSQSDPLNATQTETFSSSDSQSFTNSHSQTDSVSKSHSRSLSTSDSFSKSQSLSRSGSDSQSASRSTSITLSDSHSSSQSHSNEETNSQSQSFTESRSNSNSNSDEKPATPSLIPTNSPSMTQTQTESKTPASDSPTFTPSETHTSTASPSETRTSTSSPSETQSKTQSISLTRSQSASSNATIVSSSTSGVLVGAIVSFSVIVVALLILFIWAFARDKGIRRANRRPRN